MQLKESHQMGPAHEQSVAVTRCDFLVVLLSTSGPPVANSEDGDPKRRHLGRGLEFELTSCVT